MLPADPATGRSRGYFTVEASSPSVVSTEAQRDVPADGGGGGRCPVSPIRKEFCPVRPGAGAGRDAEAAGDYGSEERQQQQGPLSYEELRRLHQRGGRRREAAG